MNEQELRAYVAARVPGYDGGDLDALVCHGCAHSAGGEPPPGQPSGERPCVTCVRNREDWRVTVLPDFDVVIDDRGNARCFDARAGFAYNGSPYPHWPNDNYVTMDSADRDRFDEANPDYARPIQFSGDRCVVVVE